VGDVAGQGFGRPGNPAYNAKAARAKLMSAGADQDGPSASGGPRSYAHGDDKMPAYTCHLSWTTSCGGCHLPIQANWKTERHHYEGGETRNYATYNPQVARDDMFQLGKHGGQGRQDRAGALVSALVLSSTNINRERIYIQQPPIAASASRRRPSRRTTRTPSATETKTCTDCHCPRQTTTTRSWPSCCCRAPTSSTSSASTPGSAANGIEAVRSPNGTSRRR
jgi:hypothetical protein